VTLPLSLSELPRFGVDPIRGFLPPVDPLVRLPGGFEPWDDLAREVPALLSARRFRAAVHDLPSLDTTALAPGGEQARAMLLLSVFANAYVWETLPAARRLPSVIAVPLVDLADRLERLPIVAHASMVLANWRLVEPGPLDPDRLDTLITFRALDDERWFYLVTVGIEAEGAAAIPIMAALSDAAHRDDPAAAAGLLERLGGVIARMTAILERMYERCAPATFFTDIRPWLTGWPAPGLEYEGAIAEPVQLAGGSAAQSTLIQAFDAALGVAHPSPASGPFLAEMRRYMSGPHRRFLERLEQAPTVASLLRRRSRIAEPALHRAHDAAIDELDRFRKVHLGIAGRYITVEARGDPTAKGTGGTDFGEFLGAARRETQDAKRDRPRSHEPPSERHGREGADR
jgi:indoleamine 2,3-dioxygenase